jgi:hypothetical protein
LAARRQAQPSGVIETLSAGYAAVNRQLWILLLPIVVDLFLWLGPHVSYSPLIGPMVMDATEWTRQASLGPRRGPRDLELVDQMDATRQWLIAHADDFNGLTALSWGPLAVPSLGVLTSPTEDIAFVNGWADGLALLAACLAVSLLLGGWFYGVLAAASTGVPNDALAAGRNAPRAVVRVLGLVAVLFGAALLFGVPVLLLVGFMAVVSRPVAVLGGALVTGGLLFAAVHLFFATDAIFVSRVGPLGAIQRSVALVRRHLRASVALILLTWLILAWPASGTSWPAACNLHTASPWASLATRTSPAV